MSDLIINWIPRSKGMARWYESECRRFAIHRSNRRTHPWFCIDRKTVIDGNVRTESADTLRNARNRVSRWVKDQKRSEQQREELLALGAELRDSGWHLGEKRLAPAECLAAALEVAQKDSQ
jgi:hypothetical protein